MELSPYSTVNVHGIGDGEMCCLFQKWLSGDPHMEWISTCGIAGLELHMWNGTPHVEWNSTCGMELHMVKCILDIYFILPHVIIVPHASIRVPILVCGRSSGIHVWTFHGAQLLKRRLRRGIPLMEFTILWICLFLYRMPLSAFLAM